MINLSNQDNVVIYHKNYVEIKQLNNTTTDTILHSYPYQSIQIIPERRMMNKSYEEIANAIHGLYKEFIDRIKFNKSGLNLNSEEYPISFEALQPVYFEIYFSSNTDISFNLVVPSPESDYIKHRLESVLPYSDFIVKDDYIHDFNNSIVYKYNYAKHFMCALDTGHEKSPIKSILALQKDLQENDKLIFQIEIIPISDIWKANVYESQQKVKDGLDIINKNSLITKMMNSANNFTNFMFEIIDDFLEFKPEENKQVTSISNFMTKNQWSSLSSATRQKTNYDGFKCNFRTIIKVENKRKEYTLAKSIEVALKDMSADNELVLKNKSHSITNKELNRIYNPLLPNNNILNTLELAQFFKLPDNALQRKFHLTSMNFRQYIPPKELLKGKIKVGNIYKSGTTMPTFFPENRDLICLPLFILTKMGGGKTTYLLNFASDAINAKHGLVYFDYIRNCETGKAIKEIHPETVEIRFDKKEYLLPFAFPEIEVKESLEPYERQMTANIIADEVKYLLNAMASDTENLSRIMSNFLVSACKIVFIHENQTLKNVYEILTNIKIRHKYINKAIEQNVFNVDSYEIQTISELDTVVGERKIEGLLARFSILYENTLMQNMLESPAIDNINFVDIMDKGLPVIILMPQHIFTNKILKDTICTYFMSRIRLAMSRRKDFNKITHVIIDEGQQIQNTINLLADTIAQPRKFAIQYVITLHSFSQIKNSNIRDEILSVGCNFMVLKGSTESCFNELKAYISDDFEYSDLTDMNYKFGSLNLIYVNNKHTPYISELPEPLKNRYGKLYIS